MRFLVDECTGPQVAKWLRGEGHEVFSVFDEARGMTDDQGFGKGFLRKLDLNNKRTGCSIGSTD